MNEDEKTKIRAILKEMKDAQGIIGFWMKSSPIAETLTRWVETLENLEELKAQGK